MRKTSWPEIFVSGWLVFSLIQNGAIKGNHKSIINDPSLHSKMACIFLYYK
jgi:hypothetical protein